MLRKLRLKGVDDPGDQGPTWARSPNGDCVYQMAHLDKWVAAYLEALKPRAPAEQPLQLVRSRIAVEA